MQNYEEIPTLDFTALDEDELEAVVYVISEVCEQLARENFVIIKITKRDS